MFSFITVKVGDIVNLCDVLEQSCGHKDCVDHHICTDGSTWIELVNKNGQYVVTKVIDNFS